MTEHTNPGGTRRPDGHEVLSELLVGRWVRLRNLVPADQGWLFPLALESEAALRWRHQPGSVDHQRFWSSLWEGVLCQLVVVHRSSETPIGLAVAYQPDLVSGHAYLATLLDPVAHLQGVPIEGFVLFVRYLFQVYGLRKLYAEVAEFNLPQYASVLESKFELEGTLKGHVRRAGDLYDMHLLATYPRSWQ